jgi:hypothetical protein
MATAATTAAVATTATAATVATTAALAATAATLAATSATLAATAATLAATLATTAAAATLWHGPHDVVRIQGRVADDQVVEQEVQILRSVQRDGDFVHGNFPRETRNAHAFSVNAGHRRIATSRAPRLHLAS